MDLRTIFQLRTRKLWWVDVIFYFAISLLVATVLCYLIFLTKNFFQRRAIKSEVSQLEEVGTVQQKEREIIVLDYQARTKDFSELFNNHQFASNVFAFFQKETMPNVWYDNFDLDRKSNAIQLSGEADTMDALSRQTSTFERNSYVKSIGTLKSSLGTSGRIQFDTSLVLNKDIFTYLSDMRSILEESNVTVEETPAEETESQEETGVKSSEKLITSFHILLSPEIIGSIDQTNYTVTLNVPYGTDVKSLKISVEASPNATVEPATGAVQDFTSPQTYKVIAEDGSTQDYSVAVNILPKEGAETKSKPNTILVILLSAITVLGIGVVVLFAWMKIKDKKKNNNLNQDKNL